MNRNIIEIIGFVSIIASLAFVGIEISQNTSAVRGATNQAISDQISELLLSIAENKDLAILVTKLYADVSRNEFDPVDEMRLRMLMYTGLRRVENIYLQLEDGILDARAFDRIGMGFYKSKYGRETWELIKEDFDKDFVPFFNEVLNNNK